MIELGIYVGRFAPPHFGHKRVIDHLLNKCGPRNSLILVGSSNHPISYRHLFPLDDRITLLRSMYPGIDLNVTGIPDHETDALWMADLWTTVSCWRHGREEASERHINFYGGCEEDVLFFIHAGEKVELLNRFDGSGPKMSATEVRDALVHGRDVRELLPPEIVPLVTSFFAQRWEELKRK